MKEIAMSSTPIAFEIKVATDTISNVNWPSGLPIPNAGDEVVMQSGKDTLMFNVTGRHWGIGINPRDGSPLAILTIKGESR